MKVLQCQHAKFFGTNFFANFILLYVVRKFRHHQIFDSPTLLVTQKSCVETSADANFYYRVLLTHKGSITRAKL